MCGNGYLLLVVDVAPYGSEYLTSPRRGSGLCRIDIIVGIAVYEDITRELLHKPTNVGRSYFASER